MERIVIVAYKPKAGKSDRLKDLVSSHWKTLNKLGMVSKREPIIAESEDGTVIEVFGWKSKEAIDQAHSNKTVQAMWQDFASVCDYVPISNTEESKSVFSEFTPLNSHTVE